MAFNLIGDKLPSIISSLMNLPAQKFWIHETVISRELKLARGPSHGVSDVMTELITCISRGYGGNKKKKTLVMTGINGVDIRNDSNGSRITVQFFGGHETFPRGTVNETPVQRRPRWFLLGTEEERARLVTCDVQAEVVVMLQGISERIPIEDQARRRASWLKFFNGEECTPYMTTDIPAIAVQFHNRLWRGMTQPIIAEGKKPTRRSFDPSYLEIMENDLRFILAAGAQEGKLRVTGGQ